MIKIRHYLFETNSSAIHSMVILPANEYKKWEKEHYYLKNNKLYSEEEAIQYISQLPCYEPFEYDEDDYKSEEEQKEEYYKEYGFYSYSAWNPEYDLAEEENEYTTPGGEEIIIRCKYGQDY